jgi:hypothetical protein
VKINKRIVWQWFQKITLEGIIRCHKKVKQEADKVIQVNQTNTQNQTKAKIIKTIKIN